jgi:predicted metal-dependent HD superfamily phosphohydrolase
MLHPHIQNRYYGQKVTPGYAKNRLEGWTNCPATVEHHLGNLKNALLSYHSFNHLQHVMDTFQEIIRASDEQRGYSFGISFRDIVKHALLYHDISYIAGATHNEEYSVEIFKTSGDYKWLEPEEADAVCKCILATKHAKSFSPDSAEALVCDIDMIGFAAPWEIFSLNSNLIRKEYPDLSDQVYNKGRREFLEKLRGRGWPPFQSTAFTLLAPDFNARGLENISLSLDALA